MNKIKHKTYFKNLFSSVKSIQVGSNKNETFILSYLPLNILFKNERKKDLISLDFQRKNYGNNDFHLFIKNCKKNLENQNEYQRRRFQV